MKKHCIAMLALVLAAVAGLTWAGFAVRAQSGPITYEEQLLQGDTTAFAGI